MRLLVIALAVIATAFAGTTFYYAHELELERERTRATTGASQVAQTSRSASIFSTQSSKTQAPTSATGPGMPSQSAQVESEEARNNRMMVEQSRRMLKMLEDPEQRESMLIESKMAMRNSYPRLAQTLGLSAEEVEKLFTLLAEQQMGAQETYARCVVDPGCNLRDGSYFQDDPRARQIADFLGPGRLQMFDNYRNTLMERESVSQLRTRLTDATRLPDDAAESLITVLADERQKIHQEAAERGVGMNGYGTGVGMVFSASDSATPEAQLESARANSRRMRDRAAEVLNAEQLRVFDEMQDELMISLRQQVRQKQDYAGGSSYTTATAN